MNIPTLHTSRLELVAPGRECQGAYETFYTDPLASANYGGPITAGQAWARLASDIGTWSLLGFGVWAIRDQRDGNFIGTCGFWRGLGWPTELTWWLLQSARGQGFAAEASRAAIEFAYDQLGWQDVQTYMNDSNTSALALVQRLGGQLVSRQSFPDGLERNVYRLPRAASA